VVGLQGFKVGDRTLISFYGEFIGDTNTAQLNHYKHIIIKEF
jgi:hypothetical protein